MPYPSPDHPEASSTGSSAPTKRGTGVLASLLFAFIAIAAGWKAAATAFRMRFDSFDNHDSIAPLLLASPIALAVFFVVATLVFCALSFAWKRLRPGG